MIVALSAIIRLPALFLKSLYVDEAVTLYISQRPIAGIVPFMMQLHEVHPPLYFWIVNIWLELWKFIPFSIDNQLVWLRLSSVLFGVFTVWFTYLLGMKLFKRRTALLASLFIGLSSFHTYFSQELRMYPLILFLMLASFYFFLELLEKPGIKPAAGYILSSGLALLTHYYAFYMFAAEFVFLMVLSFVLLNKIRVKKKEGCKDDDIQTGLPQTTKIEHTIQNDKDDKIKYSGESPGVDAIISNLTKNPCLIKQRSIWLIISVILSWLFFLPWLPNFFNQTGAQDFTMRMTPGISQFFEIFAQLAYGFTVQHPHAGKIDLYIAASLLPIFLITMALFKSKGMGKWFAAISLILPVVLTFIVTLFSRFHIFEYKYFFIIVPAFWLLVSEGILNIHFRWFRWVFISIFIFANIFTNYNAQFITYYQPQDWKEASAIVKKNMRSGDLVGVHPSMMSISMFYYYGNIKNFLPMDFPEDERMQLLKRYRGLWLVSTPHHPFVQQAGLLNYLRSRYPRKQFFVLKKFLPSDTLLIEYFDLAPEHQGE